jgi:type IV secretory pathway VirB10-like protein
VEQDVEWQALDVLVREANSRLEDKSELEVEEGRSKEPPNPVFLLRNGQSFAVEEKLVPNVVFVTMSDNKQQQPQPPPPQPQQQAAAVLDQNVQQVQVQVSVPESIGKQCFMFCVLVKHLC